MQSNERVQAALRHVHEQFPQVSQVFYGIDGRWMFCDEDFHAPDFEGAMIDIGILEDAADAAGDDEGFPCAFRMLRLSDYYDLWDELRDVSVSTGNDEVEAETIEKAFLHFHAGTHREEIWRWFEAQHPDFLVGEVMQGIRRNEEDSST